MKRKSDYALFLYTSIIVTMVVAAIALGVNNQDKIRECTSDGSAELSGG